MWLKRSRTKEYKAKCTHQTPAEVVNEVEENVDEDENDGLVDVNEATWGC